MPLLQIAKTSTNSISGGPSITIGAGHLIVGVLVMGNSTQQTATTFTDGLGNTYHKIQHVFNSSYVFGGTAMEMWYAWNVTGGAASFASTGWTPGGYARWEVAEYTGGTSDPLDTSNTQTGNSSPSIALTLAHPGELVVSSFFLPTGSPMWVWTDLTNEIGAPDNQIFDTSNVYSFGDFHPTSSGAYTVTGTSGVAGQLLGIAAAFTLPRAYTFDIEAERIR